MTANEIAGLEDILNEFSKDALTYKKLKETGNSEGKHQEFYRGKYEAYNRAWTILKRYMLWHSIIDKE